MTALLIGVMGAAAASAALTPPYQNSIATSDLFNELGVEDANGDDFTWYFFTTGYAHNRYNWQDKTIGADDYLYTPGLELKGGAKYTFECDITNGYRNTPQKVEIVVATAQNHESVIATIMPMKIYTGSETSWTHEAVEFTAPADGVYYFAIHDIADPFKYGPNVKNISVSAPTLLTSPGAVTNLKAVADQTGALNATITFTAPAKTVDNQTLTELSKVEIYRGEDLITTLNPAIGTNASYVDNGPKNGNNTYKVIPYNSAGAGEAAEVTEYVGFDYPLEPVNIKYERGENNGQIIVSWDPVTKDERGKVFPAGAITYDIYRIVDKTPRQVGSNYADTQITDQAVIPDGRNSIVQYQIISKYGNLGANFDCTDIITVGKPYTLPFKESVPNGATTNNWRTWQDLNSAARWTGAKDTALSGCKSQDNDNGYFLFNGSNANHAASIISSAIKLDAGETPLLSFYVYKVSGTVTNKTRVWIRDCYTPGEWKMLKEISMLDGMTLNWNRHELSLAEYAGKEVQIAFEDICSNYIYSMIDNIRIVNAPQVDIVAEMLSAPGKTFAGADFNVTVNYLNRGIADSGAFTVKLFRDNNMVEQKRVENVAAGARGSLVFTQKLPVVSNGIYTYRAEIICDNDPTPEDNNTSAIDVLLIEPGFPSPTDMVGESVSGDVVLEWSAPGEDGDIAPTTMLDDFETYSGFVPGGAGDWKFVDRDGGASGSIRGLDIPGLNPGEPATWMVFDANGLLGLNPASIGMETGAKCLAVLYNIDQKTNDDWAISPRLSGFAQTISFDARLLSEMGDKLEVMASSTDTNPDSFTKVAEFDSFKTSWNPYTVALPEGALYFAFRYCSKYASMLFIDNVEYQAYMGATDLELTGYHVYRNGEKLTEDALNESRYVDAGLETGIYMYQATAAYGETESTPCDFVVVNHTTSGVEGNAAFRSVARGVNGSLLIATAEGAEVTVANIAGEVIYQGSGSCKVDCGAGVYVVRIADQVFKINVR